MRIGHSEFIDESIEPSKPASQPTNQNMLVIGNTTRVHFHLSFSLFFAMAIVTSSFHFFPSSNVIFMYFSICFTSSSSSSSSSVYSRVFIGLLAVRIFPILFLIQLMIRCPLRDSHIHKKKLWNNFLEKKFPNNIHPIANIFFICMIETKINIFFSILFSIYISGLDIFFSNLLELVNVCVTDTVI